LLWCLALAATLAIGTDLKWALRIVLVMLTTGLAEHGYRLLWRENRPIRRVSWGSDGRWQLQDGRSGLRYVALYSAPRLLGPLIWLPLAAGRQRLPTLIDARYAEPAAVSALKARLKLHQR
jgi:hypothetical protein